VHLGEAARSAYINSTRVWDAKVSPSHRLQSDEHQRSL
jgi:hypothetical protein